MADSRGKMRPHHNSRSPPFVLVGLLVVIAILAFNYWGASSSNNELLEENDKLSIQLRQTVNKVEENSKLSEDRLKEINKVQEALDQLKSDHDQKTARLSQLEDELDDKKSELESAQRNTETCEASKVIFLSCSFVVKLQLIVREKVYSLVPTLW